MAKHSPKRKTGRKSRQIYGRAAQSWDKQKLIRDRLLTKKSMFRDSDGKGFCKTSLTNCFINYDLLKEYTSAMAREHTIMIGTLSELKGPLKEFQKMQRVDNPIFAHQDAWTAKRLLGLLRRKWQRDEAPRETWLCQ
jgi:hypothetical protein